MILSRREIGHSGWRILLKINIEVILTGESRKLSPVFLLKKLLQMKIIHMHFFTKKCVLQLSILFVFC